MFGSGASSRVCRVWFNCDGGQFPSVAEENFRRKHVLIAIEVTRSNPANALSLVVMVSLVTCHTIALEIHTRTQEESLLGASRP